MKTIKKIAAMMLAAALVLVLPGVSSLKVSAASPTTYYVFYDGNGWSYQIGNSQFNADALTYDVSLIMNNPQTSQHPQDGDSIVFQEYEDGAGKGCTIDVGNVNLQNVTVVNTKNTVVVKAASIYECYILQDGNAAINGNVSNAYVYDRTHVNFNNNVTNLYITADSDNDAPAINVLGTVAYAKYTHPSSLQFEYYNFNKGAFVIEDAVLRSTSGSFSTTGDGPVSVTAAASEQSSSTASATSATSDEYDKVPKTGEAVPVYVLFFAASAVCFAGSKVLKRI